MHRALLLLFLAASAAAAQSAPKPPVFDVVAIRPIDPSASRAQCYMRGQAGGQTFTGRCINLATMVKYAYKLVDSQLSGQPDWFTSEFYDFEAKTDRPATRAEVGAMFQAMIEDRFHLQFHKESRPMQAFVLSVDKSGHKMTPNTSDYEWDIPIQPLPSAILKVKGIRCPMYYFTWWVGQSNNRPVVDKTGLSGFWDFTLKYLPDAMQGRIINGEPVSGPSLSTALREQLGLKLEAAKTPVDVYVIDHVEKPGAN
jgi:uncharacterized protein (TIGR03435 family)